MWLKNTTKTLRSGQPQPQCSGRDEQRGAIFNEKNKIDVLNGFGKVLPKKQVSVTQDEKRKSIRPAILYWPQARSRELPSSAGREKSHRLSRSHDLAQTAQKLIVVGSGAIGIEFAYFYNRWERKSLVEYLDRIVPVEDEEVSKQLERSFKKAGINILTSAEVTKVNTKGSVTATVKTAKEKKN